MVKISFSWEPLFNLLISSVFYLLFVNGILKIKNKIKQFNL